jgi:hypothetical protein
MVEFDTRFAANLPWVFREILSRQTHGKSHFQFAATLLHQYCRSKTRYEFAARNLPQVCCNSIVEANTRQTQNGSCRDLDVALPKLKRISS